MIAYFSMEIGLESDIKTYSGGLGILAGDILRTAADIGVPYVGVTLIYQSGYFRQILEENGEQHAIDDEWVPSEKMKKIDDFVEIKIKGDVFKISAWLYEIKGKKGVVPVYFLDTGDDYLTRYLYMGNREYRFQQEMVLGIGGYRLLKKLGYDIKVYHMNEGHSALLSLELLKEQGDIEKVKRKCAFTTHTPVPAGHDIFDYEIVKENLPEEDAKLVNKIMGDKELNMTLLAMKLSGYINAVSKRHHEVTKEMFKGFDINYITNGVHSYTWTSRYFAELYDKYIPEWKEDPENLQKVDVIPDEEIWEAHKNAKRDLIKFVEEKTKVKLSEDIFTVVFAKRMTKWKRGYLIFKDIEKLKEIGRGKLQIIFAGKAHPYDEEGKEVIMKIFEGIKKLKGDIKCVYLKNYDIDMAKYFVSGADLWLQMPLPPYEASSTSGMKAAHNGVPLLSTLDGWWCEGRREEENGWTIEDGNDDMAAKSLYEKLKDIMKIYYGDRKKWIKVMKGAIKYTASRFNTHRVLKEYLNAFKKYLLT